MEDRKNLSLEWKVNIQGLFQEILSNDTTQILEIPLKITLGLLNRGAARAYYVGDFELVKTFIRLGLYGFANPETPETYQPEMVQKILEMDPEEWKKFYQENTYA